MSGDLVFAHEGHACTRETPERCIAALDLTRCRDTFPAHLCPPWFAGAIRTTEHFGVLLAKLHALFAKLNPGVSTDAPLPRTVRPEWTTLDVVEAHLGRPERLVEGARFFAFEGHLMVALPYMLLENNACAAVLIAPAETSSAAVSPFYLHPRAWRVASLLIPVFVPCECLQNKQA